MKDIKARSLEENAHLRNVYSEEKCGVISFLRLSIFLRPCVASRLLNACIALLV